MASKAFPALLVALALPVAAQTAPPRPEAPKARIQPAAGAATPHERARIAKAQNKDTRCGAKQKEGKAKKAAAT